jgi:hypothetical protein
LEKICGRYKAGKLVCSIPAHPVVSSKPSTRHWFRTNCIAAGFVSFDVLQLHNIAAVNYRLTASWQLSLGVIALTKMRSVRKRTDGGASRGITGYILRFNNQLGREVVQSSRHDLRGFFSLSTPYAQYMSSLEVQILLEPLVKGIAGVGLSRKGA